MNCSEGNLHSCLSKPQIMPEIITENQVTPFSVVIPMAIMLGYIMGRVDKTTLVEDCLNRLHKILNVVKRVLCSRLRIQALKSKLNGWVSNQEAQKLRKPLQLLQRTVTCRCSRGETRGFEWLTRGLRALHMLKTPGKEVGDDDSDSLTPPPISPYSESDESSTPSRMSSVCTPCSVIHSPSFSGRMSPLLVGSKKGSFSGSFSNSDSPRYNKSPIIISSRRLELDLEGMIEDHRSVDKSTSPMPLERSPLSPQRAEVARAKLKAVIVQDNGSLDGRFPAAAWICGKDAPLFQLKDGFGWLDLVESSLQCVYGEGWKAGVHPDDLPNCMEAINLANNGKGPFQMEYRLKVSQDEYRWVMDVVKARFSSTGIFLGFVGWRVDTHDRKIIESNYWKYWLLPHEFLTEWSADGKYFTKVSPAFPSFLGYQMEEFKSTPWLEFIHPDDRKSTEDEFVKLRDGKPIVSLINRIRCKPGFKVDGANYMDATGIYKWLNWTASDVFSACRDISEDRLAHEELRSSKEELQRIADIIPGGIFLYRIDTNKEGSFPYVSKGAASLLGCHDGPENHVVHNLEDDGNFQSSKKGKAFGHNVHPDDWPRLEEAMHHAAVTTNPLDHDYRYILATVVWDTKNIIHCCKVVKDGEIRWVRVHSVPKTGPNGSTDWYGITWDMTKQHQAVDALREARDNAEKAALAKGNFLAHMSHEIRTPMNAVIGMGALLLETDLTDEQRDYVVTIRNSGEALLSIINDILDYSKIEAGKMERETVPLDIVQLIRESFDLVVPQAAAKGLEITYTVSEAVNLLTNAVKFTERGGISVSVDGHKCPSEVQNGRENGTNGKAKAVDTDSIKTMWEIKFSVKDSGIGIPDDRRSRLFQAFSQVDASTTRRFGGTGLGLAICARLTALHGGRIWVDGAPGEGSTFNFTILAEDIPEASKKPDQHLPCLHGKRVLIVVGSSSTQSMCARFLRSWHMRPVCTSSGAEALGLLRQIVDPSPRKVRADEYAFDAMLVDSSLVEQDDPAIVECMELCHNTLTKIRTILLVPYGRRSNIYDDGKKKITFNSYVSKPVKESNLLNELMYLLVKEEDVATSFAAKGPRKSATSGPLSNLSELGKVHPLRLLIAEDNKINQKVLVALLGRLGYTADVVNNGLEALETLSQQKSPRYDVCFMDCYMPIMDGMEATKRIRAEIDPCPVIVAVTAAAMEEERQGCLQAGMHMYISKPIQVDELTHALRCCWRVKQDQLNLSPRKQNVNN